METGIDALDTSIHKTNRWLKEIQGELGWNDRRRTWSGLRAVLHALRDRLTFNEAFDLAAELPMVVRGMYTEGWERRPKPLRLRSRDEFLMLVSENLSRSPQVEPEPLVRAVFGVLRRHLCSAEIDHVLRMLPEPVRGLWPHVEATEPRAATPTRPNGSHARRTVARRAKREISLALARARAGGAREQDLPLMVSRGRAGPSRRRRPARRI